MAMVIGYGSNIRGDRAAGRAAADAVALRATPGVWTYSVDHLTRAHAEAMADVGIVVFVGTYDADEGDPVRVTTVADVPSPGNTHYVNSPESLLALFRARHGRRPEAWSVLIPAAQSDLHAALSPSAEEKVMEAVARVLDLLHTSREESARRTVKQRVRELLRI
jgi:Ni,Fe-hydrogenase maturation factor